MIEVSRLHSNGIGAACQRGVCLEINDLERSACRACREVFNRAAVNHKRGVLRGSGIKAVRFFGFYLDVRFIGRSVVDRDDLLEVGRRGQRNASGNICTGRFQNVLEVGRV